MATTPNAGFTVVDSSPEKAHDLIPQLRDFQFEVDTALGAPLSPTIDSDHITVPTIDSADIGGSMRNIDTTAGNFAVQAFGNANGDQVYIGGKFIGSGATAGGHAIIATRPAGGATLLEGLRVGSDQRVSIGAVVPDAPLTVAAAALPTTYNAGEVATFIGSSDNFATLSIVRGGVTNPQGLHLGINNTSHYSEIQASQNGVGTNVLLLNRQGGDVGIGTSDATARMHVVGGNVWIDRLNQFAVNGVDESTVFADLFVWENPSTPRTAASFQLRQNLVTVTDSFPGCASALHTSIDNLNGRSEIWGASINAQQATGGTIGHTRGIEVNIQGLQSIGTDPFGATSRVNGIEIMGISGYGASGVIASYLATWHPEVNGDGWAHHGIYVSRVKQYGLTFQKRTGAAADTISPFAGAIIFADSPSPAIILAGTHTITTAINLSAATMTNAFLSPNFVITGTGSIGVGTTTPAALAHLYSTANTSRGLIVDAKGTGTSQEAFLNLLTLGDGAAALGTAGVNGWSFTARGDAFSAVTALQNDMQLYYFAGVSPLAVQSWDHLGNVGFGTESPTAKVHILSTTEQLRLAFGSVKFATFTVDTNSLLTIAPTSGSVLISGSTSSLFLKDTSTGFQASSSTVINPAANNAIRSTSYTSGLLGWNISALGNAEFNNVDVRGAIHASIFTYNAINVTAGTQLVTPSGAKLKSDVVVTAGPTYGTTAFQVDVVDHEGLSHAASQLFAVNDILRLKDGLVGDTWFKVTAVSDQTTFWRYTASIQAGTANVTYRAGMGVPDYGVSGKGGIMLTADQTNAPYLQMFTHAGTFSSADASGSLILTPQLRLGNLNGSYGYVADIFGFGTGQYGTASKEWLTVDQTNGLRIGNNVTTLAQWAINGDVTIGEVGASKDNVFITAGAFSIRNNTTARLHMTAAGVMSLNDSAGVAKITLDAAAGMTLDGKMQMLGSSSAIAIGVIPPLSSAIGTGVWIDRNGIWGELGVSQVETTLVVGPVTGNGDASVTVTAAAMAGSPYVLNVAVLNTDTATAVATKVRAALDADATFRAFFNATGGTGANVSMTAIYGRANDATMNLRITNGTCTGLTLADSANTTAGSNTTQAKFDAATGAILAGAGNVVLDVSGISLAVDPSGFTAPGSIKFYNSTDKLADVYSYGTAAAGGQLRLETYNDNTSSIVLAAYNADKSDAVSLTIARPTSPVNNRVVMLGGYFNIGATSARAISAGVNNLNIFNGTDPSGTLTNGISLYSSGGQLFAMDSAGVASQLTAGTTSYTPSVSSFTGTITTVGAVSGRYKRLSDKLCWVHVDVVITTNGTGGTLVIVTLPFTSANTKDQVAPGRENGLTSKQLNGGIPPNDNKLYLTFYDATYPGANGARLTSDFVYETT